MPEANIQSLNLDGKSPNELEARRMEIVNYLKSMPGGYDDDNVPTAILHELAVISGALRRRTAGPPKVTKKASNAPKQTASLDDILN